MIATVCVSRQCIYFIYMYVCMCVLCVGMYVCMYVCVITYWVAGRS